MAGSGTRQYFTFPVTEFPLHWPEGDTFASHSELKVSGGESHQLIYHATHAEPLGGHDPTPLQNRPVLPRACNVLSSPGVKG